MEFGFFLHENVEIFLDLTDDFKKIVHIATRREAKVLPHAANKENFTWLECVMLAAKALLAYVSSF